MPVPKEVVDAQLRALPLFKESFTKKEIAHLPDTLQPGEVLHAIISGMHNGSTWLVAATTHRVLFLDKGLLYGLRQLDLPLDRIDGIAHKTGLMFGEIAVATGGANWKVENVVPKQVVAHFAEVVNGLARASRHPAVAPPPAYQHQAPPQGFSPPPNAGAYRTPGDDFVSRLERLGALRQSGVLTEEEFQSQKQRILNGG